MIIFFAFGIFCGSIAGFKIITAGSEFNNEYFEEKGISLEPELYPVTKITRSIGNTIPVNFVNYTAYFVTEDIFANRNPFNYSIKVFVENPNVIERMVMFFYSEEDFSDDVFLNYQNIDWYMDTRISDFRAVELFKNASYTFGKSGSLLPGSEQDVFLFLAIKQKDGGLITSQKGEIAFTLYPKTEKIQANLVRVMAEEIITQQRNNDVIIALTLVILATIFLTPAFQISFSIKNLEGI